MRTGTKKIKSDGEVTCENVHDVEREEASLPQVEHHVSGQLGT
jgi:hypothetical protein